MKSGHFRRCGSLGIGHLKPLSARQAISCKRTGGDHSSRISVGTKSRTSNLFDTPSNATQLYSLSYYRYTFPKHRCSGAQLVIDG
jgi:hypothetical protein